MPTYDYRCDDCGKSFERFQKMSDEPLKQCPECGGHVKRLVGGGSGIIFKGSGFYCTDYHGKGAPSSSAPAGHKCDGSCCHNCEHAQSAAKA